MLKKEPVIRFNALRIGLKYAVYILAIVINFYLIASVEKYGSQKNLVQHLKDNPKDFIKNARTNTLAKFMPRNRIQEFEYDCLMIKKLTSARDPLVLISRNDTLYYAYTQRKSFFKIAFYPNF